MNQKPDTIKFNPALVETGAFAPTWGELGKVYVDLATSNEQEALKGMHSQVARAFAAAEALQAIQNDLPDGLREKACAIFEAEMTKQGLGPTTHTKGKESQQ